MSGGVHVDIRTPNGGFYTNGTYGGLDNVGFSFEEQEEDDRSLSQDLDDRSLSRDGDERSLSQDGIEGDEDMEEFVVDVLLEMLDADPRFGFSVIGGLDEGIIPMVDEILPGSPADRADLDVGDEILEVNGNSLDSATHAEVIAHIQQCVKTRSINLRVKRRTMREGVVTDPEKNKLHQAYVIAVEQQTKDKLNKLAAQKNIETIDLAAVQTSNPNHIPQINGHLEPTEKERQWNALNSKNNQEVAEELAEPSFQKTQVESNDLKLNPKRLSGLFGEDVGLLDLESFHRLAVNASTELDFSGFQVDTESLESASEGSVHSFAREPSFHQNVLASSDIPQIDLEKLIEPPSRHHVHQTPSKNKNKDMATPSPSSRSSLSRRGPPREMAVDCPESFVAASGMKIPPAAHHGSNGHANNVANGPTMVNGYDSVPNYHPSRQGSRTGTPKVNNIDSNHKHHNLPIQNSSHNNSQGMTVSLAASLEQPSFSPPSESKSSNKPISIDELFSSLNEISRKIHDNRGREDVQFLKQLFHNSDFQQALNVHNQIAEMHHKDPLPLPESTNAEQLAAEIALSLRDVRSPETEALRKIFANPNTKAVFHTHDSIAGRDPTLLLPAPRPSVSEADEEEEEFNLMEFDDGADRVVRIQKTGEPLGATIWNDGDNIMIGRIVKGGMAQKTGLLHEGDQILEINGEPVSGLSVDEISDMMSQKKGTLQFRVIPARDAPSSSQAQPPDNVLHYRALFDYEPEDDEYIPCKELGLTFGKGDILHVINKQDANWWQAYREDEDDQSLAGLIPSQNFQRNREAMTEKLPDDEEPEKGGFLCRCNGKKKKKKKKKKNKLYNADSEGYENDEILAYEEVGVYQPSPNRKRPIVLIGPNSVGRNELRQKLLEDNQRFRPAVPHTSRSMKDHEVDGMDYHFVTRQQLEQDIAAGKFAEHGEFEKNLYGTSLRAIEHALGDGRICVLNLHPQSLKILKKSKLHPYFIFVCPPSLDRLRQQRTEAGELLTEEKLRDIIDQGRAMQDAFGHYFDCVIIHYDHDRAFNELLREVDRIQTEPQWVPIEWTH